MVCTSPSRIWESKTSTIFYSLNAIFQYFWLKKCNVAPCCSSSTRAPRLRTRSPARRRPGGSGGTRWPPRRNLNGNKTQCSTFKYCVTIWGKRFWSYFWSVQNRSWLAITLDRAMQKRATTVFRKIRFSQSCVADASIPSVVSWWHGVVRVVFVGEIGSRHPTRNWKKGGKAIWPMSTQEARSKPRKENKDLMALLLRKGEKIGFGRETMGWAVAKI